MQMSHQQNMQQMMRDSAIRSHVNRLQILDNTRTTPTSWRWEYVIK
jgi:hypothetical protein